MRSIVTITLNPSIDKSTTVHSLVPEKKMRYAAPKFEPAGGGVNVSRALKKLGCSSTAIFLAGGYSGKFYETLLQQEEVEVMVISMGASGAMLITAKEKYHEAAPAVK